MSFIDVDNLDKVKEPEIVPEGMYDVTVEKVIRKEENGELKGLSLLLNIDDSVDAAPVFHYLSIPMASDEEDKAEFKKRFIKKFIDTFNVPFDKKGFDEAALPGCTAKVKLVLDEYNGTVSNKVKL